jgi:hypothetical protein
VVIDFGLIAARCAGMTIKENPRLDQILPDGQISDRLCFCLVQPHQKKYFCFSEIKSVIHNRHPVPHEGRIAIVTDVGTGCGGRGSVGRHEIAGRVDETRERSNGARTKDASDFAKASADWHLRPVEAFGVDGCCGR